MPNCLTKIKIFFTLEFFRICHKIHRNQPVSIMLIIVYFSQIYSIFFKPLTILFQKYSQSLYIFNQFFRNLNFDFNIKNYQDWDDIFILFILCYQLIFLLFLLTMLMMFLASSNKDDLKKMEEFINLLKKSEYEVRESSQQKQEYVRKSTTFYQMMEIYISIGISLYPFIFYHPVLSLCLQSIITKCNSSQNLDLMEIAKIIMAIFVLLINILLLYFSEEQNFSFSYKQRDFLRSYVSLKPKILTIILEVSIFGVLLAGNLQNNLFIHMMICLGVLATLLWLFFNYPKYVHKLIHKIQIQIFAQFFTLNICVLMFTEIIQKQLSLIIMIMLPISISLINHLFQRTDILAIAIIYDEDYFDYKLIQIYNQCQQVLGNNGILMKEIQYRLPQNLLLYAFAVNHLVSCKGKDKTCFCVSYRAQESFISRQQFKKYIKDLIRYHYEQYLSRNNIFSNTQKECTSTYFFYIQYLSEIIKQPTKAFHEMIKLKYYFYQKMNQTHQMIIQVIEVLIKQEFCRMVEIKEIVNQKYDCFLVFNYDKSIKLWKFLFISALNQQKNWYILLTQNNNINLVLIDGLKLQNLKEVLENQLEYLFCKNPYSSECQILVLLFHRYINFNSTKIDFPKLDSPLAYKFQNSITGALFHRDAALVYLTLMNVRGIIKHYTRTFREALCTQDKYILDKSINDFIPNIIAEVHDIYLDNFVERGRINIMQSDKRFLLVKNTLGFIFPIIAKVKIETSLTDDFGTSALIFPTYQNFHYILLNSHGIVEEISEKLFKQVINQTLEIDISQIRQLDCLKLIPRLISAWKNLHLNNQIDKELLNITQSYLIIPKKFKYQQILINTKKQQNITAKEFLLNQDQINEQYFSKLQDIYMFKIQFKVIEFQTFQGKLHCIEIQTIKSVQKSQRLDIFDKLIDKTDYSSIRKKTKKITLDRKERRRNFMKKYETNAIKESFGYIQYNLDPSTLCNIESQKLIEDNYMIYQKELQVHLINPQYDLSQKLAYDVLTIIFQIEETQNLLSMARENQERKIVDAATSKMKSSGPITNLTHFNSSNSNVFSQLLNGEQMNKIVPSSAILEALNDNEESMKSQQSIEISQSQDNFLHDIEYAYSSISSKISDLKIKKVIIKNNLFNKKEKHGSFIFYINQIVYFSVIVCNIVNYHYLIEENNVCQIYIKVISTTISTYRVINNFEIFLNHFVLSFNQTNIDLFNYSSYIEFSAVVFENNLFELLEFSITLENRTGIYLIIIQVNYLQISDAENITQIDLYQSLKFFSQYMLYQSNLPSESLFLELISRNYITIIIEFKNLNETAVEQFRRQFTFATLNTRLLSYFTLMAIFCVFLFYLIALVLVKKTRNRILRLFHTISNQQLNSQIESISLIMRFFEHVDFENQLITEQQFDQIKYKISQSPGMTKIKQSATSKAKIYNIQSKSYIFCILYAVTFMFVYFVVSSPYFAALIYQNQFEQSITNQFIKLTLYTSTQQYLVEQICLQQMLIKYTLLNRQDALFQNKWSEAFSFMQLQLTLLEGFIQSLNDEQDFPNNIFSQTIKQTGCLAFELSASDISKDADFYNSITCSKLENVQKGITIDLVNNYQQLQQFYLASQNSRSSFTEYLKNYNTIYSFESQILTTFYTSHILSLLHDEIASKLQDLVLKNYVIHTALFSLEIILFLSLFIISNLKLEPYLYQELTSVKQLLLLIPLEFLCDNAYVLQFALSQNNRLEV